MNQNHENEAAPQKHGAVAIWIFLAVFVLLSAAVILFTALGSSGSEAEELAMRSYSVVEKRGETLGALKETYVYQFPTPEDTKETWVHARIAYVFEKGTVFAEINSAGASSVPQVQEYEGYTAWQHSSANWLFHLRRAFEFGWFTFPSSPFAGISVGPRVLLLFGLCALIGYLLGGINTGVLISSLVYRENIREKGSGNPGATNMLRCFGVKAAVMTLMGDLLKVFLALVIAAFLGGAHYFASFAAGNVLYITGLAAVLGHMYPIYYHFKGGKGVTCTLALALYTAPIVAGLLVLIFIGIVALTRYVSLGSVLCGMLYPVVYTGIVSGIMKVNVDGSISLPIIIVGLLILWAHRKNIQRLMQGTENKISVHKKA